MALMSQAITSEDDTEIGEALQMLLNSDCDTVRFVFMLCAWFAWFVVVDVRCLSSAVSVVPDWRGQN